MPNTQLLPARLGFQSYIGGQLRTDLRRAFLKSQMITNEDCEIGMIHHNDEWWLLILEGKREAQILERYEKLWAILSFQESKDGQRIVIARAHRIGQGE
jgi:hypothetical protein